MFLGRKTTTNRQSSTEVLTDWQLCGAICQVFVMRSGEGEGSICWAANLALEYLQVAELLLVADLVAHRIPVLICFVFVIVLRHSNIISVISWWWYDVWDEKEKATLLPTQRIFNLPHHILYMLWEELAFYDVVSYTQRGKWTAAQLNVIAVTRLTWTEYYGYRH